MAEKTITPGERICAYIRDSGGTEQELSIQQQEKAIGEFCRDNGLILTRVFKDVGRSGSTTASREQFLKMVEYITGDVEEKGVLLWSYSRFSRDYDDTQFYLALIRQAGKSVISLTDQVEDSLDGRIMESLIAWQNAKYRQTMSADIKRGHRFIASQYKAWPGGFQPIGYRKVKFNAGQHRDGSARILSRIEPDPEKAPLVVQVFEMRAAGATYQEILQKLPELPRSKTLVSRMLHNRLYIGILDFGDSVFEDFCEPIIDMGLWSAAQRVNTARKKRFAYNKPRSVRSRFILSGLVWCSNCGMRLTSFTRTYRGKTYDYYGCTSRTESISCGAPLIPKERLEKVVDDILLDKLLQPEIIDDLMISVRQRHNSSVSDRKLVKYRRGRAAIDAKITRLVAAIADVGHSTAILDELKSLENQRDDLRAKEMEHEARIEELKSYEIPDVDEFIANSRNALESANLRDKVRVIREYVKEVRAARTMPRTGEVVGRVVYGIGGVWLESEFLN